MSSNVDLEIFVSNLECKPPVVFKDEKVNDQDGLTKNFFPDVWSECLVYNFN